MHKRNISIVTAVLAAIVSAAFFLFPALNHSDILGLFYVPAIFLVVLLSGRSHSPAALAGWSAFVVYTLFYWAVFLVVYAILLEMYLVRKAARHLDEAKAELRPGKPDSQVYLEHLGRALVELETRRRKHFLLQNLTSLDLSEAPALLAARAIAESGKARAVKGLVKRLQSKVAAERGSEAAAALVGKLKDDADRVSRRGPRLQR